MPVFTLISPDCYLFTWGNSGGLMSKRQADLMAIDLLANGLIELKDFPSESI